MTQRGAARLLARLLALGALAAPGVPAAAGGGDLEILDRFGAPDLVARYLDDAQPDPRTDPQAWAVSEAEHVAWLVARREWRDVLERRDTYPEQLPATVRSVADGAAAEAYRALGDPSGALRLLDGLLEAPLGEPAERARWSQLRVRVLLDMGDVETARAALAWHRDAFPDDSVGRALLEARLLLADGHLEEVLLFLDGVEGSESALLRLAAVAGSRPSDPWGFLRAAAAVTDAAGVTPAERHQAWALVARVAADRRELALAATALENALGQDLGPHAPGMLSRADADGLWESYDALARQAANARQLLVGRDDEWFALGAEYAGTDPVTARALFARLALDAKRTRTREAAGARYAELAGTDPAGRRVAAALWTASRAVSGLDAIPESVRPVLVIELVASRRYEAAGVLVPPDGLSVDVGAAPAWGTAYARSLIRVGLAARGVDVLVRALAPGAVAPHDTWRATIAASADLVASGDAVAATRLLDALARTSLDARRAAVLSFQRAEALAAAGDDAGAALAYLRASPGLGDADGYAARELAAAAAARAGLDADAAGLRAALAEEAGPRSLPALRGAPIR